MKEISPEAKLTQILINKNIQFSIKYLEVQDNIFEWTLWDEDKDKKIIGIRTEDRDEAVKNMCDIIANVTIQNADNA